MLNTNKIVIQKIIFICTIAANCTLFFFCIEIVNHINIRETKLDITITVCSDVKLPVHLPYSSSKFTLGPQMSKINY